MGAGTPLAEQVRVKVSRSLSDSELFVAVVSLGASEQDQYKQRHMKTYSNNRWIL